MTDVSAYGAMIRYEGTQKDYFLADLADKNAVERLFGVDQKVRFFSTGAYNFDAAVRGQIVRKGLLSAAMIFGLKSLADIHELVSSEMQSLDVTQINGFSKALYEQDDVFLGLYHRLIQEIIAPLFEAPLYFQATPTIRFHFPNQKGFDFKPTYHSDIMLGHPPGEVNVWLPVTPAFESNSIKIMRKSSSLRAFETFDYDFDALAGRVQESSNFFKGCEEASRTVEMGPGQFLLFDPRCIHATQHNVTNATRVSMDFRVITVEDFQRLRLEYRGTGRRRMIFAPGHYYDDRTTDDL